jgi:hypothetical protein
MSNNNNSNSGGIGFLGLLTIVFIVLKLCKVIDWSWWWITCPLWGPLAIAAIILPFYLYLKYKEAREELNRAESGYNRNAWRAANQNGSSAWKTYRKLIN